jgi:hypothetical protein
MKYLDPQGQDRIEKLARLMGRRSGGDRRCAEYAVFIPDRRIEERRKYHRRQQGLQDLLDELPKNLFCQGYA